MTGALTGYALEKAAFSAIEFYDRASGREEAFP
jgi:hypothetical protein